MKTLEYIKNFMDEKITAYEQVEANPQNYDKATREYAKQMKEDSVKWYNDSLEMEAKIKEAGKLMVEGIKKIYPKEEE